MGDSEITRDGASMRPSVHGPRDRAISQEGTQCPALHHNLGSSVTLDGTSIGTSGCLSSREAQNVLRTLALAYSWAESPNTACFTVKCWISHVIYWVLYWKWKQNGHGYTERLSECWSFNLPDHEVDWELGLTAAAHKIVAGHIITRQGKIKIQHSKKFLLDMYHFYAIIKAKFISQGPSVVDLSVLTWK